jgi:hypothetical protein
MYRVVFREKANQNEEQYICKTINLVLSIAIRLCVKNSIPLWTEELERIRKGGDILWQNWIGTSRTKSVWIEEVKVLEEIPKSLEFVGETV